MTFKRSLFAGLCTIVAFNLVHPVAAKAQLVPGSGQKVTQVGDDFEDLAWEYHPNGPKSSEELDQQKRLPNGRSANGRWQECLLRGQPDVVQCVETPAGGLPGSTGALLLQSLHSGTPGRITNQNQQDDIQLNVDSRLGGAVPVSRSPSVVVRVFLPPFEEWENRTGTSFGFRADVTGVRSKGKQSGFFGGGGPERETYWPGIFIMFNSESTRRPGTDSAHLIVRGEGSGRDFRGAEITQTGWWTLGMSFTPDGRIHYYAKPGVEDLTADDHIASHYPYGFRCERFNTFFFNTINRDDGRSWSTAWVIDDPSLYCLHGYGDVAGRTSPSQSRRQSAKR
jgi:hypothetical protein